MNNRVLGGILLVSGTTIGAGMLALPVSTGLAGFIPSSIVLLLCWLYMTYTAFLMLEVTLWMEKEANLVSMAKHTIGRWGQVVCWLAYLFLLYALTTAYIAGSGPIMISLIHAFTGYTIPTYVGAIPVLLLFGFFVYKGTRHVDGINRALMMGLVISYAAMMLFLSSHVDPKLLMHVEWPAIIVSISVVITAFGFHIIIPSLSTYLERHIQQLKLTILIGSIIPLMVYLVWQFLALGIIPLDKIAEGYVKGTNGASLISDILGDSLVAMTALFFSFFAIVTSFLGVSLSLSDFLADGFKIKKTRAGRSLLYLLTFVPPLIFTLTDPRAFLSALEYAGAFGVIVLLGLMPAVMVWRGRYVHHYSSTFKAPGGKGALIVVMGFSLVVVGLEIAIKLGIV